MGRIRLSITVCLAVFVTCSATSAESPPAVKGDREFSLRFPDGPPPQPGNGRRVTIDRRAAEEFGLPPDEQKVMKVLVEVGDLFVVVVPDGRLVFLPQDVTRPTKNPFVPITKTKLLTQLKKRFPGFKTRTTKRYVYVYNTSQDFAVGAGRILETLYPGLYAYCQRHKIKVHPPAMPLVVIMFKTRKEFKQYHQRPIDFLAYYETISNHVVMYEQSELTELAPELALKRSISTIAHEGVHQILHNIGVQHRMSRWPKWIGEGLPEYFAPTEVNARSGWKGVGLVNDLRLYELQQAYQLRPSLRSGGQVIRETVEAKDLDSFGYACSWSLVHFLATRRRDAFYDYLREVSQLGPLTQPPAAGVLFRKYFGHDYAAVEDQWIRHLQSLPTVDPMANQTHYLAVIRQGIQRSLITTSPENVRAFKRRARGNVAVWAFPNRQTAMQFAESLR